MAKLGNKKFIERAPKDVVAKDQARSEELAEQLAKLQETLTRAEGAIP